eukprot:9574847-Alexandrium_andersonii.AAC.1
MRSRSEPLRRLLLVASAHLLVTQIRIVARWVPSAWNPADGPSRGEAVGPARETLQKHQAEAAQALGVGQPPPALGPRAHL